MEVVLQKQINQLIHELPHFHFSLKQSIQVNLTRILAECFDSWYYPQIISSYDSSSYAGFVPDTYKHYFASLLGKKWPSPCSHQTRTCTWMVSKTLTSSNPLFWNHNYLNSQMIFFRTYNLKFLDHERQKMKRKKNAHL